jgi:DNA-binding transcriptional regulator YiaG
MSADETYLDVYNQDPGPIQDQAIRAARDALAVLSTGDAAEALRRAVKLVKEWGPNRPHPHSP